METIYTLQIDYKARLQIEQIAKYIAENGYPETAIRFALQMFEFAESLTQMPDKYAYCKKSALGKWQYRCAIFHTNYIFVYKVGAQIVHLKQVIHGKRMK